MFHSLGIISLELPHFSLITINRIVNSNFQHRNLSLYFTICITPCKYVKAFQRFFYFVFFFSFFTNSQTNSFFESPSNVRTQYCFNVPIICKAIIGGTRGLCIKHRH
jgi:hypothetical protein